ncbi:putative peptidyl-tRNA hydrolase [Scleropages formosus]|uniref:peptidyl-tRNA hydrolase n=1 Tax=Scleropages formosus TaxID=113540 RepID=A0A0P7WHF6_SCLFO|nr:putative peptidyl-tRNA hydrolase [Scleropages formosus]
MFSWVRTVMMKALVNEPWTLTMSADASVLASASRKMVVGLGNPGMGSTRHSVGMAVVAALSGRLGVSESWRGDRPVSGEVALCELGDTQLVLLRPRVLMNLNGISVAKAAAKFHIQPEHILLVHDELDKPLGKFSLKKGGSARGHNGVKSCVECLQTNVMPRLLIGIGRPAEKALVNHHVLGRFSREEQKVLSNVLEQSVDLLLSQLTTTDLQNFPKQVNSGHVKRKDVCVQHSSLPPGGTKSSVPQTDLELHCSPLALQICENPANRTETALQCSSPTEQQEGLANRTELELPSSKCPEDKSTTQT